MKSEDGRRSFKDSQASVCSQLFEDVKTETYMKDGETSSSVGNISDQKNDDFQKIVVKEEPEDKAFLCRPTEPVPGGDTSKTIRLVDQETKAVKEEETEAQDFLYCEECGSSFIGKCEVHGPACFIPDTPVPMGVTDRARQTLPPGLEVRGSGIPNAGLGVFNVGETLPVGVHFGPYEGDVVDRDEAMNSGYSWVIYKNRQGEECIDATQEMNANWMRYVNCARNDEEQNLVAFQYRGRIFYRCCRAIKPGQELLVWYDEEYAKDLGSAFDSLWNKKCSANGLNDALFQIFSCTLCPLSYMSETHLHKHMRRCHCDEYQSLQKYDAPLPTSSLDYQQTSSDTQLSPCKRRKKGIHRCSVCGRGFTDLSNLKTHQRIHTGEKPFQCPQCGKSFTRQRTLEIHQRIHTGEKPYYCLQCGKSFAQQITLQRHQLIHTGVKLYPCSQCGKSFTHQYTLQRHQLIHTGVKPFICSQCGKRFTRQSSLKTHQRFHTGEKPYNCVQCWKSFTQLQTLINHQHIHTGQKPYSCTQCGRSFPRQDNLKIHQRIHTGEKPYQCSQCGKSFTQHSNLQTHQRIHSGEKPYHCSQCGKSFNRQSHLKQHQHIHTRL